MKIKLTSVFQKVLKWGLSVYLPIVYARKTYKVDVIVMIVDPISPKTVDCWLYASQKSNGNKKAKSLLKKQKKFNSELLVVHFDYKKNYSGN